MPGEEADLDQPIPMRVGGIVVDPKTQVPVVVLRAVENPRLYLPIFIGGQEATAIATVLADVSLPRPMTHDLMAAMLTHLECTIERVTVTRLDEGTFYAELSMRDGLDNEMLIDARPSDSIALALRVGAPIFVARPVIAEAGAMADPDEAIVTESDVDADKDIDDDTPGDAVAELAAAVAAAPPGRPTLEAGVDLEDLDPEVFGKYKM